MCFKTFIGIWYKNFQQNMCNEISTLYNVMYIMTFQRQNEYSYTISIIEIVYEYSFCLWNVSDTRFDTLANLSKRVSETFVKPQNQHIYKLYCITLKKNYFFLYILTVFCFFFISNINLTNVNTIQGVPQLITDVDFELETNQMVKDNSTLFCQLI